MSKTFNLRRRGESLIEVLIAVVIIGLAFTAIERIMQKNSQSSALAEHTVTALSLAEEGLEAMHAIRNSNGLRYSGNARECWNFLADNNSTSATENDDGVLNELDAACTTTTTHRIAQGNYLLEFDPVSSDWFLTASGATAPAVNGLLPNASRLKRDITSGLFRPIFTGDATGASIFRRQIAISYPDTTNPATATQMRATVTVQWTEEDGLHSVVLSTDLFDHIGRVFSL